MSRQVGRSWLVGIAGALLLLAAAAAALAVAGEAGAPPGGAYSVAAAVVVTPSRGDRQRPRPAAGLQAADSVLLAEGFEGAWPAAGWDVVDQSDMDGGEYLWGKRDCQPHQGSYAGWSVGGGTQGGSLACTGQYPNNANAWAVYGPLDLSAASSARLEFDVWGRAGGGAACQDDSLFVGSSLSGLFFTGERYCGDLSHGPDGNGYWHQVHDLSRRAGEAKLFVGFNFSSDGSQTDIGFTIDDIQLIVEDGGQPPPENTPTATATATSGPEATATATATATEAGGGAYLPVVVRPLPPTPTPTPRPTATSLPLATLFLQNDTGGQLCYEVKGVGIGEKCVGGGRHLYGSFPRGHYDYEASARCGKASGNRYYGSGDSVHRFWCAAGAAGRGGLAEVITAGR